MKRTAILALLALLLTACAQHTAEPFPSAAQPTGSMELAYAEQFTVDYYGDAALVTIAGEERYLLVPEGEGTPEVADAAVVHTPLDHIYLASSSAMDPFQKLGALGAVRFTGTAAADWSIPEVADAMDAGDILYVGKYRAPDYELLLAEGCAFAVENTMILHSPATREQLEALGIPTMVERSSYESHPLGRLEWIKLYGLLVGKAAEAEAYFDAQTAALADILAAENTGKTAAVFYVSPNGYVNVRRPGDYVSRMIALAGGLYVPTELEGEDNNLSTINMQFEAFYAGARDADVLIYNSTIYPMDSLAQLLAENDMFADFKAVQTGNVWVTEQNLFQETSAVGGMIADFHAVLNGTGEEQLTYLRRLR